MWTLSTIISSVGLILTNKLLTQTFPHVLSLSLFHFVAQHSLLSLLAYDKRFKIQRMSLRDNVTNSTVQVFGVVFMNISLKMNSVGFYQLSKLASIPLTVMVQTVFYGVVFSRRMKFLVGR